MVSRLLRETRESEDIKMAKKLIEVALPLEKDGGERDG